jgi:dihydrofolate synthase/folylpolyglutamate synthase
MTAAGFMHFKNKQCDYVSLEVGLGGRNDTTNLVHPEISIITSIGLDHTDLLGPTLDHIAR